MRKKSLLPSRIVPTEQSVVVTGRGGGSALRKMADTVSEVKDIKHAFNLGIKARRASNLDSLASRRLVALLIYSLVKVLNIE